MALMNSATQTLLPTAGLTLSAYTALLSLSAPSRAVPPNDIVQTLIKTIRVGRQS